MLGIDARTFRVVWTVFLFALLLGTAYAIRDTLILLAVSVFVAYMIVPLVDMVEKFMPRHRALALSIVYVVLVAGLITIGVGIGSKIVEQAGSLSGRLPNLLQASTLQSFPLPSWLEPLRDRIVVAAHDEASKIQTSIVPLLQRAGGQILSGLTSVVLVVLVPIISFFLLKDARTINRKLTNTLEEIGDRRLVVRVLTDIHNLLSNYIRALVFLAVASFIAWSVFLYLTGEPYELLLAGISGILEFIPAIGPAVALVVIVLVCSIGGKATSLLLVIGFWIVFRLFQDYVLNPYLMSSGVEVHPLLVLLGILAGEQIYGVPGMFFSVPVIAILKVVITRVWEADEKERLQKQRPPVVTELAAPQIK
jgi:predicted PurR-regulated permease PerM